MSTDPSTTESTVADASTEQRQRSCEERISEQMASREEQFAALLDPDNLDDDDVIAAFNRYEQLDQRDQTIVEVWKHRYAAWDGEGVFSAGTMVDPDVVTENAGTELDGTFTDDDELDVNVEHDRILDGCRDFLRERGQENLDEELLGVDIRRTVTIRIDLSTGGPADFITAEVDPEDGSVDEATYHFQDWFDGATRGISPGEALWNLVEYYAGMVETEPREPRY